MRWGTTKEEVRGFGVNYTAPFAHAYRRAKQLNISLEKAIDEDVYHFSRLGFDAYRVHVWDVEISDTLGNVLNNDHLRLFDYTIKKMKERGIKFIITPIAYWNNGWPEPDEKTPGFSAKYGKDACLTNPDAIKAQETYLSQFLNHVNTYTGLAYKNDPDVIAFEVCNEPHHQEAPPKVTEFINRMVKSMRDTGCKKPIFYNTSHMVQLEDAYFDANIQGGTFQWYPTGLGANHELGGNLLVNVDKYTFPYANNPKFKKMAKIVYEFDAADIGRSYIYPAMARSFRSAGLQVAMQFAYDPTYTAYANTEYGTHYMNLAYAPQKALSLKIASEVFHQIPLYQSFGSYPGNASFGNFRVSYEKDLAEMASPTKFFYTNSTTTTPPAPTKLEQIAGFGNSPMVSYEGQGAYFLDKVEKGVWRLEVMPDAIWISDPFMKQSPKKEVAVINWRGWPITIHLADLGDNYRITGLNKGNTFSAQANDKAFTVSPGTYLLVKKGVTTKVDGTSRLNTIALKEFVAPAATLKKEYVLHQPLSEIAAGQPLKMEATVASVEAPQAVELHVFGTGYRPEVIPMTKTSGYTYVATVPEKVIKEGFLRYYIVVKSTDAYRTYPSGVEGRPGDWDFYDQHPYQVRAVATKAPLYLFDAITDAEKLDRQWLRDSRVVPTPVPGRGEWLVQVEKLFVPDSENTKGARHDDYSLRYHFGQKVAGRQSELPLFTKLTVRGRTLNEKASNLQVALVTKDGSAYGGLFALDTKTSSHSLLLKDLKRIKLVTLPRPYPSFLPYYFENNATGSLDMNAVESLQISIGPGIPANELNVKQEIAIESVLLE